jgi:PAS domain S-box-containing protein
MSGHGPLALARALGRSFEGLLDAAPDAIVIVDAPGEIALVNQQAERLFGYGRHELLGQRVEILIPGRFQPTHAEHRAAYARDARPRPMGAGGVLFGRRKDGSEFPAEISLSPVDTEVGRLVMAGIRDVTERLVLLAREQAARAAAEAASRARDDVLAVVSHDLQNLINAVSLNLAVLLRAPASTEGELRMRRCGEVVDRSVSAMMRLLRDLLEAQRMEHAEPVVTPAAEDIAALLRETVTLMEAVAADKDVRLSLLLPPGLGSALCERERIQQVLQNLVGNAIHFTPAGREVRVSARRDADALRVSVADEGPGIPAAQIDHVFDRYWRGRGASRQGIGLGLFIVRRIVEAHGGRISVASPPGSGAVFTFELPAAP